MGNSSTSHLPAYSCNNNLSRNSVSPEYWDSSSISSDFKNGGLTTGVIFLMFFIVGLPANAIIITAILLKKLYKDTTHILLLSLAVSDFLMCLLVWPVIIVTGFVGKYILGDSDYVRCQVCQMGVLPIALIYISVFTLSFLSVDRFIYIKFPLRYSRYVTVPRVTISIITVWMLSIAVSVIPLLGFGEIRYNYTLSECTISFIGRSTNSYYILVLVLVGLVPVTTIIVTNIWIACIVRKQIAEVYKVRRTMDSQERGTHNDSLQERIKKQKNTKQLTLIRVFGAILVANFVAWFPLLAITILLQLVDDNQASGIGLYIFAQICLYSHAVFHPLIEGCIIPDIKKTFKTLFGIHLCQKHCCKKKVVNIADNTPEDSTRSCRSCLDVFSAAILPEI